jgi:type IX secretion system PorP/SprF family membrane protein
MKCYINIFLFFILLLPVQLNAQQFYFGMFQHNPVTLNPAFTGNEYRLSVRGQYKTMWNQLENAPATSLISAHTPIGISASSVGAMVYADQFGFNNTTGGKINYAYRFTTSFAVIAVGAEVAFENYKFQLTQSHPGTAGDPALAADYTTSYLNAGTGIALENDNGYFGIAAQNLFQPTTANDALNDVITNALQLNVIGAYTFPLSNAWDLTPSMTYSYIEKLPSQMAMQFEFAWQNNISLNLGYRSNNAYSAGFAYTFLDYFLVGYQYDYYASTLSVAGGGHEIVVGFDLNKPEGE